MKEKVIRFQGYSEKAFWIPFIEQMVDNRNYSYILSGGDVVKQKEIMLWMYQLIYAMYSSVLSELEFNTFYNQAMLSIEDASDACIKKNKEGFTTGDVLDCLKKNWTKHYKYMP